MLDTRARSGRQAKKPGASRPTLKPKAIALSQRPNIFFLERARVLQKDGRVLFLTDTEADVEQFFNIPHQNTSLLLLGKGTSITDSAIRMLADAGVMVGFTGSGASPMFSGVDAVFLPPQGEYRATEYMQSWMRLWLDDAKRLSVAKAFLIERMRWAEVSWAAMKVLGEKGIVIDAAQSSRFEAAIAHSTNTQDLLSAEAVWVRGLYDKLKKGFKIEDFVRDEMSRSKLSQRDVVNGFLTHGNYVAYGVAAVSLYALGISFALPILHGRTRRGALVFDVADLFKDATVLPLAFFHASLGSDDQTFRNALIDSIHRDGIMEKAIRIIQKHAV